MKKIMTKNKKAIPAKSMKKNLAKDISANKQIKGDIAELILRDHALLKDLISSLSDSSDDMVEKKSTYQKFERYLTNHSKAEQESLYAYLKKNDDLKMLGLIGETEHTIADQLMKEIDETTNDEETWPAKVKVLTVLVDAHVKEEEKNVLIVIRKQIELQTRIEIGKEYSQIFKEAQNMLPEKESQSANSTTRNQYRGDHA